METQASSEVKSSETSIAQIRLEIAESYQGIAKGLEANENIVNAGERTIAQLIEQNASQKLALVIVDTGMTDEGKRSTDIRLGDVQEQEAMLEQLRDQENIDKLTYDMERELESGVDPIWQHKLNKKTGHSFSFSPRPSRFLGFMQQLYEKVHGVKPERPLTKEDCQSLLTNKDKKGVVKEAVQDLVTHIVRFPATIVRKDNTMDVFDLEGRGIRIRRFDRPGRDVFITFLDSACLSHHRRGSQIQK